MASGFSTGFKISSMASLQGLEQRIHVVQLLARDALAQLLENPARGLGAHIGGDQARLEIIEDFRIDLAPRQQFGEIGGEPGRALSSTWRAGA